MHNAVRLALAVGLVGLVFAPHADAKEKAKAPEGPTFDKSAASASLASVDLVKCKVSGGPRGEGHVQVTFAPQGAVAKVLVDKGPYVRSPVERCIVAAYQKAHVPAFSGEAVTVGKAFRID
ncbi:MAG: hypothetical protein U0183_07660 [Polyangiaceae bacterium]